MQTKTFIAPKEISFVLRTMPPIMVLVSLIIIFISDRRLVLSLLLALFILNVTLGVSKIPFFKKYFWSPIFINGIIFSCMTFFSAQGTPSWLLFMGPLAASIFIMPVSWFKYLFLSILIIPYPTIKYIHGQNLPEIIGGTMTLIVFSVFLFRISLYLQKQNAELDSERQKSESLLLNILPEPIAIRMKAGERSIADIYPRASVLFADISGFTPLAGRMPANELIKILGDIFAEFDHIIRDTGVTKIKTIGDAYMVAAGVADGLTDHAQKLTDAALQFIDPKGNAGKILEKHDIRIRIGLHTGPLVAGVIGNEKFSYDVWGDTVNIASRLESHGQPGRIHCSIEMKEIVEHEFIFESNGKVNLKGKGELETFFLVGKKR